MITMIHVEQVMGTAVSFDVRGDERTAAAAIDEAVAWLHHVDRVFSPYKDDSEITRFGRGDLRFDELSDETADVLLTCRELEQLTDGAFDAFAVPAVNGTTVDPSGYVKGWSIERAATMLESHGLHDFCINAGGDVAVRGVASPGRGWSVGIRHPEIAGKFATVLHLAGDSAVATSATYERPGHIIDPRSESPACGVASVTAVGRDLGFVDACATAIFVMGLRGLDWAARQRGVEAYVITNDGMTSWTSGFPIGASQ